MKARDASCYIEQDAMNSWSIFLMDEDENRKNVVTIMRADGEDMDNGDWEHLVDRVCSAINERLQDGDSSIESALDSVEG